MNMRAETTIPLDGDHRNVCKFSSRSSLSLGIVLQNLADLIRQATVSMDLMAEARLLQDLATSNPDVHKSRNPKPVPGTCGWILKHATYTKWLESQSPSLLWLSADPGCGKSVLVSYLIDHLRSQQSGIEKVNVCYFFFKSDNDEQRDAIYGLQAVLHQLLQSQRGLLEKAMSDLNGGNIRSVSALWRALLAAMQQPIARDTICVLDGFDECEPASRKALTQLLSQYFAPVNDPAVARLKKGANLKFLISSRPENSLKIAFDRPRLGSKFGTTLCSMIRLRGEDETDAVSRDISLVIDAEISEIIDHGFPEELLEDVRHELVARADRTFLWVTLILQLLKEKVEAGASRRELEEILRSRSVDVIYAGLLSTRPDAPKARKLLSIVLAATRPLSVEELSIALAVQPEVESFDTTNLLRRPGGYSMLDIEDDLVYPFENHLKALCGNFIRVIRNSVYLVHETAREFLLETQDDEEKEDEGDWFSYEDGDDDITIHEDMDTTQPSKQIAPPTKNIPALLWQHSFSMTQCHAVILEVCVTYIYCMGKQTQGFKTGEPTLRLSPFLDYAAIAWMSHLRQVRDELSHSHLPYYQNLCHPRFPGFAAWIRVFEEGERGDRAPPVGSYDEIQDYYVNLFEMELDAPPPRFSLDTVVHSKMKALSSNPGAAENHHFPVTTNANGWVSLNVERVKTVYEDVLSNPWS